MRLSLLAALALLAGGTAARAESAAPARVEMTDDGPLLLTPAGKTLYTFGGDDNVPGRSACSDEPVRDFPDPTAGLGKYPLPGHTFALSCVQVWPPFMAPADATPTGDWGVIERKEGRQWTYRKHPLYTSVSDVRPGDRNGSTGPTFGRGGFRLAAGPLQFPPGLSFTRVGGELVLATAKGRPVYASRSARLQRACVGCADAFKPIAAASLATPNGDWAVIENTPGVRQYAFKGRPLYLAPEGMTASQLEADRDWTTVTFRKIAPPPTDIRTRFTLLGDVFTTKAGLTLYTFNCAGYYSFGCDLPGGPAAYWSALCGEARECSRRWRPYLAAGAAQPSGGDWSIVEVADPIFSDPAGRTYTADLPRVKVWAWRGKPVYTYHQDKQPGDIWGHQVRWFSLSNFAAVLVPGKGSIE